MCRFIVWYPHEFSRLYNLHPWYWNSLFYGLISSGENSVHSGENSVHFLQLMPFTIFHFFLFHQEPITAGWAGSMEWEVCLTLLHMTTSSGNRAPEPLILSPYPIHWTTCSYVAASWSTCSCDPTSTPAAICFRLSWCSEVVSDWHRSPDSPSESWKDEEHCGWGTQWTVWGWVRTLLLCYPKSGVSRMACLHGYNVGTSVCQKRVPI